MTQRLLIDAADPGVNPYRLLTALVVPRPIAWVSTVSAAGVGNLAPHSFFSVASARPPMVTFTSVGEKDTLANVRDTGEFVVNVASVDQMELVNATSALVGAEVDEAAAFGVEMEASQFVRPLRVAAAPASIECRAHSTVPVGNSVIVIGEVLGFALRADVMHDGHPSMEALRPVSRLGADEWGLPPEVVRLTRPS